MQKVNQALKIVLQISKGKTDEKKKHLKDKLPGLFHDDNLVRFITSNSFLSFEYILTSFQGLQLIMYT